MRMVPMRRRLGRTMLALVAAAGVRCCGGREGDAYLNPVHASRIFGSSANSRTPELEAARTAEHQRLRAAPFRVLMTGDSLVRGCGDLAFYPTFDQCECTPSNTGFRIDLVTRLRRFWATFSPSVPVEVKTVGTLVQPPSLSADDAAHEAYPGLRVDQLADKLRPLWRELSPHMVVVVAGVHDLMQYASTSILLTRLEVFLDDVMSFNPGTRIFLGSLVDPGNMTDVMLHSLRKFNKLLPKFVQQRRRKGQEAFFVDIAGQLPLYCVNTNISSLSITDTPFCCANGMGLTKLGYSTAADLFATSIATSFESEGSCPYGEACAYDAFIAWRTQVESGLRSYRSFNA